MKTRKRPPKDVMAAVIVSVYLLIYCQLLWFESTQSIALLMLAFSPVMIIWMVYMVIRHGTYKGRELGKNEYGYSDRPKEDPGSL